MSDQQADTKHYAILIGIDAYPSKSLTSCVRDVEKIKACLESKLTTVNIQTLTASSCSDPSKDTPAEDPDRWPTYRNVTSALEKTTSQAEPGDFIYIHYSGHGTRLTPCFDFSNRSTGDLALVLLEGAQSPEKYLRGVRLAGFLKAMVEKGLVITLALDCCFSASVYRNDEPNIRYLSCDLEAASTFSLHPEDNIEGRGTRSVNRDASMRDNWLLDPDRYTILAACGPHENAKGGWSETSDKGGSYGALSYFLSEALSNHGFGRRHKDIHRHLCARFWDSSKPQHPVLYGNGDQGFFGEVDPHQPARLISIVECDGSFQLLAGQAHGFRDGDQFLVCPLSIINDIGTEGGCIAKITYAGPLTSNLELLDTTRNLQTGCVAVPLACSYLAKFCVKLATDLPHYDKWITALKNRSLKTYIGGDQLPDFQVVLSNDEYEILDEYGQNIINLPRMPQNQTDTGRICDILEHLAGFKMVKDLTNKTSTPAFQNSFDIQIISDKKLFGPETQIEVVHDSKVELVIKNIGDTVLYAHIYNLDSCWQIKSLLRSTYEVIPPRKDPDGSDRGFTGKFSSRIKLTVPAMMRKHGSCEDFIKVFITSQPTSFDLLELPSLDELVMMNNRDRISHLRDDRCEDWVALGFPIRTLL